MKWWQFPITAEHFSDFADCIYNQNGKIENTDGNSAI